MLNKVTLIGNLGDDPVSRTMPGGGEVANFSVATSKRWKDKQTGEQKEHTEWHRVAAFGKLAEICNQWLKKGAQVYIEGELRTRSWDKEGVKHYSTEVVADQMKMLGRKREGDSQGSSAPPASQNRTSAPAPDDFDDDIPF